MDSLGDAVLPAPTFCATRYIQATQDSETALSRLMRGDGKDLPETKLSGLHPLSSALLAQVLGALLAACLTLLALSLQTVPAIVIAGLQGFCAMIVAWQLGAPVWWLIIHLVFMPLVVFAHGFELPSWIWLSGFIFLLLVFWRTDTSQVPLYLTNRKTGEALLTLLPGKACRVIDLGCGDGGLLRYLARARPDCTFVGIEHAPLPFAWAWLFARGISNLSIRREDIWSHSLARYALIYAFLSPVPMGRLWTKVSEEMSPDSCLVSNSFVVPGHTPQVVIDVADRRQTRLHVYRKSFA